MEDKYVYTVTERRAWSSLRPGSIRKNCGTYQTIEEANAAFRRVYQKVRHAYTEDRGWQKTQLDDARYSYDCENRSGERTWSLRIEKASAARTNIGETASHTFSRTSERDKDDLWNQLSMRTQLYLMNDAQYNLQRVEQMLGNETISSDLLNIAPYIFN